MVDVLAVLLSTAVIVIRLVLLVVSFVFDVRCIARILRTRSRSIRIVGRITNNNRMCSVRNTRCVNRRGRDVWFNPYMHSIVTRQRSSRV